MSSEQALNSLLERLIPAYTSKRSPLQDMATFTRKEIAEGIERLGQLAVESGIKVELVLVGGALMVLRFRARESTRDVDVAILAPTDAQKVRELARRVGEENDWPDDWLNDGAKGYLIGLSSGPGRAFGARD